MTAVRIIVIMGPAASGKSTVGRALAAALGWDFFDADDYHSPANIARMQAGEALGDADRQPWLAQLRALLHRELELGRPLVLACSALREVYREALLPPGISRGQLQFVYLEVRPEVLALRLIQRRNHFLTGTLLESQLATLEKPEASDDTLWLDGERPVAELVGLVREQLGV